MRVERMRAHLILRRLRVAVVAREAVTFEVRVAVCERELARTGSARSTRLRERAESGA